VQKTAVVTGGSRNIGQGIAIVLAEHGYDVAITYRSHPEGAEETKQSIEKLGRKCFVYQASLDQSDVPAKVMAQAHRDLGHIDVCVCNAGKDRRHSVLTVTAEQIDELFQSNFRAYSLCAGAAARHMIRDGIKGSIIFITSTRAERAYPSDFVYGGLKAGIKRACESIALDLSQYGIRVNCVAPGGTLEPKLDKGGFGSGVFAKEVIPLGRIGIPRDDAEVVAFLASDKASYITGTTVRCDGGLILSGMPEDNTSVKWVDKDWQEKIRAEVMQRED